MTDQAPELLPLEKYERDLFQAADDAYFKAGNTSDPQDWLQAALLARQHRNALTKLRITRPPSERPVAQVREGLDAAIRAANLALFVIRKEDVMPNDSWQSGFDNDMATARSAQAALTAERPEAAAAREKVCKCGVMCQDHGIAGGCRYLRPERYALRKLVDIVYQHATESTTVPATNTADLLIDRAFGSLAIQHEEPGRETTTSPPHRGI